MIQDWINVLDKEFIFWHRVHNLETALKNAKNKLWKTMWKTLFYYFYIVIIFHPFNPIFIPLHFFIV